jgi:CyaY protein
MNDNEFNALADAALQAIEAGLERSGADLDFEMVNDQVLQIEFADGSKILVNRHDAMREIWVAARSGGFHYRWNGQRWQDARA